MPQLLELSMDWGKHSTALTALLSGVPTEADVSWIRSGNKPYRLSRGSNRMQHRLGPKKKGYLMVKYGFEGLRKKDWEMCFRWNITKKSKFAASKT